MPVTSYMTWGTSSASVQIGETISVPYTNDLGMSPNDAGVTSAFNGLATGTVSSGAVSVTGVSAGTVTVATDTSVGNGVVTANDFTLTVVASSDDQNFLNERGLAHFWENIDAAKQDKLTAGDNISITSNTISADTGWVYLGEQSLSANSDTATYTLPAQYDNYKVVFYGTMASTASDGGWVDFIMLNGSTAINVVHQVQLVEGTTWSATWNSGAFALNGQINPYAGVTITFESFRAGSADWRVYKGSFCSNAGGSATTRSTIVNGRATSGTQPTAFQVKSYSGNFITGSSMRVWASNNGH